VGDRPNRLEIHVLKQTFILGLMNDFWAKAVRSAVKKVRRLFLVSRVKETAPGTPKRESSVGCAGRGQKGVVGTKRKPLLQGGTPSKKGHISPVRPEQREQNAKVGQK
jgi:hypothetical protein